MALDILFRIDLHKGTQNPRESNMEEQVIHSRDKYSPQELDLSGFKTLKIFLLQINQKYHNNQYVYPIPKNDLESSKQITNDKKIAKFWNLPKMGIDLWLNIKPL